MTTKARAYLLDTNIFIQAKNEYYSFAVCPGFWEALPWLHERRLIWSIDRVKDEIEEGKDDLADWVADTAPETLFSATSGTEVQRSFSEVMAWVQGNRQFTQAAKAGFAAVADGWLIAYARTKGLVVVTQETYEAELRKRVKIPNVCEQFNVQYVNTFRMLEDLKTQFTWAPPR
jgi:hypothetical protein